MKDGKTHSPQPSSATGRIAGMKRAGRAAGGKAWGKKNPGDLAGSSVGWEGIDSGIAIRNVGAEADSGGEEIAWASSYQ